MITIQDKLRAKLEQILQISNGLILTHNDVEAVNKMGGLADDALALLAKQAAPPFKPHRFVEGRCLDCKREYTPWEANYGNCAAPAEAEKRANECQYCLAGVLRKKVGVHWVHKVDRLQYECKYTTLTVPEAPASQPGVSADQLRQASEQAFMNIPDPHTSSAHFNEMARLLNAALASTVPQSAAAPAEPPLHHNHWPTIRSHAEAEAIRQRDRELKERCVRLGIDEARDAITQAQGYLHAAAFLAIQELNPAAIAEKVPND